MAELREVIQNPRYDEELAQIDADVRATDQATHAAIFALARHPERGFPIAETTYSIWPVYIEGSEYVIYYTFDDDRVELISIYRSGYDLDF